MTVGAVLSGAYAGDKQSPLSDTTNLLAAGVTNTDLYTHIRRMRTGTAVAFGLAVLGFLALGLRASGEIPVGRIADIQGALGGTYAITLLAFIPLVVTFGLALRGYAALPTLVAGVFAGAIIDDSRAGVRFRRRVEHLHVRHRAGVWVRSGERTARDGRAHRLCMDDHGRRRRARARWYLGADRRAGGDRPLVHLVREEPGALVAGTGVSAIVINALTAQQYMSIVLPSVTLRNTYDEFGLDSDQLSRAVEAAGTPTGALFPWHAGAVYMAGVTGVPTLEYAPPYLFAFLSPLVLFVMAATGYSLNVTPAADRAPAADEPAVATDDD